MTFELSNKFFSDNFCMKCEYILLFLLDKTSVCFYVYLKIRKFQKLNKLINCKISFSKYKIIIFHIKIELLLYTLTYFFK